MAQQPRTGQRVALRHPVALTLVNGTRHDGETIDLSPGGICLTLGVQVRLAQLCAIHFAVVLGGARRPVLAMGQVVYCDPDGAAFRVGVQFVKIDPGSVDTVALLLAAAP